MLSKEHKDIIEYLSQQGYGWARFAISLEKQGWCSDKQYETMVRMKRKLENQRVILFRKTSIYGEDTGSVGCSDSEAMSFGEYF